MFPSKSSQPSVRYHHIRLLGANGADPTKEVGQGVTVTRTGEGAYKITWSQNPGTFLGFWGCFGAATPADMKGYTVVRDTFTAATSTANAFLEFVTYDSSFTAADVIANQYLDLTIAFKAVNV